MSDRFAMLQSFIAQSPRAMHIFSPEGLLLAVNKAWEELWEKQASDEVGKFNIFNDPQLQELGIDEKFRRVAAGEPQIVPEHEFVPERSGIPGRGRWVKTIMYPVCESGGTALFVIAHHEDVTEARALRKAHAESSENFRRLMKQSPNSIEIYTLDGVQREVNRAWEELWHVRPEDTLNRYNVLKDEQAGRLGAWDGFRRAIAGEKAIVAVCEYDPNISWDGGGRKRWVRSHFYGLHDAEGKVTNVVIMHEDITDLKEAGIALVERANELEELNISMKVLLRQITVAKEELENKIVSNIRSMVMPYLADLEVRLTGPSEKAYVTAIRTNLEQLTGGLSGMSVAEGITLTPREMQVANLIRQGSTSKDIATLLGVSPRTVEFYRENIRKKFNLSNKKVNLQTYLTSTEP